MIFVIKQLKSISHNELENFFRIIHSRENPEFFNVDDLYNDFINNHKKIYYFHYVKCVFSLVFHNNFSLVSNLILIPTKRFVIGKTF